ncbi:MAG TPA: glycosyltransferase, partial [Nitrososphaeraceae archaeon]|nr:glycosyltransferase [Nitrososphaeraceae archaeon]
WRARWDTQELVDTTSIIQQIFEYFWLYFPLGIIGFYRWSVWGFKRICAQRYEPVQIGVPTYYSSLSIVTPVYNEDPALFKKALESWEASYPDELIAVIDQRDIPCIEVFKEFAADKHWAHLVVTPSPGKRPALALGIKRAKSKIVALVDSDVIWSPAIKEKLLAPFRDPQVGGVAVKQNAIESRQVWQKIADMLWDQRNYLDWPSQAAMGRALTCLSGRTAVYRRHILLPLLDKFVNEIILDRQKESGEDKCLTRLVQKEGWRTYYQSNVQIYTAAVTEFNTFWKQKIRWTRNTYNSDFTSMFEGWIWKRPYLAFFTIDKFISVFTLLIGPIAFCISLYLNHWILAFSIIVLWLVGRGIKLIPHLRHNPKNIKIIPVYVFSNFWMGIAKLYALVTIRDQKWIRPKNRYEARKRLIKRIKNVLLTSEIMFVMIVFVYSIVGR